MEEYAPHHHHRGKRAVMMFVFGLVIILARLYTTWDIWVVIGVLMMAKAVFMAAMAICCPMSCPSREGEKKV
jgi:hypothetical protein